MILNIADVYQKHYYFCTYVQQKNPIVPFFTMTDFDFFAQQGNRQSFSNSSSPKVFLFLFFLSLGSLCLFSQTGQNFCWLGCFSFFFFFCGKAAEWKRFSCWFTQQSDSLIRLSASFEPWRFRQNRASKVVRMLPINLLRPNLKNSNVLFTRFGI